MSFSANGSIYVIGGVDQTGIPGDDAVDRAQHGDRRPAQLAQLDQTQLPEAPCQFRHRGHRLLAYLIAGAGTAGPLDTIARANLSPQPPFFQLGILGATIPGLSIKGEIGQQLGYINAMTVGMINFVVLILLGYAMSHRAASMRLMEKLSRGKVKAPRDDEYVPGA